MSPILNPFFVHFATKVTMHGESLFAREEFEYVRTDRSHRLMQLRAFKMGKNFKEDLVKKPCNIEPSDIVFGDSFSLFLDSD